ncbi:3-ketosteroid reductase [Moelleriella libera RCEF 2490]|uniref:3-ketosteroid reductase n=1 Tax=Moelleriella libera RCEF 2490 TaxID=1081109 RepID=A0A168CJX5_9HYPO|nr:3-ketosteroid reductase [Moelleriella libera RCEF 2490]
MAVRKDAATAPWESVSPHEQLFVLVTGANSGIGLGLAQSLIDDFLRTRSLRSHLIVLPTTRSRSKSLETVRQLRAYATTAAQKCTRSAVSSSWRDAVARIHILSLSFDLCDLRGLRAVARALRLGTVSNPPGLEGEYLVDVRIPRLDSIICNAAYGGWSGLSYPMATWSFLTRGLVQTATWPDFKHALPTGILNERAVYNYPNEPLLGEVFCACVFGHYMLAHQLLPLLSRSTEDVERDGLAPGRIIWSSSLEAIERVFSPDDLQCLEGAGAYESAKRLTDLLSLTHTLPAAQRYSTQFLTMDDAHCDDEEEEQGAVHAETDNRKKEAAAVVVVRPRMYLSHPGIVASTLFPLPAFLFWLYRLVLVLAVGRRMGIEDATAEHIARFEEQGAACWRQLELLRTRWEKLIDDDEGDDDDDDDEEEKQQRGVQ